MLYNHINSADTSYDRSDSSWTRNIESNANTNTEERDEWSFAGVLFDIYDSVNEAGDPLATGDDEAWTVMRNDRPQTVEQFFQRFITRYPSLAAGLEETYLMHGMHPNWLTLSAWQLKFGGSATQKTFTIRRTYWYGDGVIVQPTWTITKDASWITVTPDSGSTTTETDTVTVTVDRSGLAPGTYTGHITVTPQYYGRPQQIAVTCAQPWADGSIVGWGYNGSGQCNVPSPNSGFVAVAGGHYHSLGLKADGSIVAWGGNAYGQCNVPPPNSGFVAVAGGWYHSLGLKADGSIVAWGAGQPGQSGWPNEGQCDVPAPNSGFVAVAAGILHSLGLKADGLIVAWGYNGEGWCNVPAPNSGFVAVAAGGGHSLGLKADGSIVASGENADGQCNVPSPNSGFVALAAGAWHSLAIRGRAYREPVPGDVDGDGDVDIFDVIDTINAFGTVPGDPLWNPNCDFDGNGIVDIFDVIDAVNNFGTGT